MNALLSSPSSPSILRLDKGKNTTRCGYWKRIVASIYFEGKWGGHTPTMRGGGLGSSTIFKNLMSPTPRRKWYLTTGRRAHWMVLDPIPQSLPVHFFGSRPQLPHLSRKTSCTLKVQSWWAAEGTKGKVLMDFVWLVWSNINWLTLACHERRNGKSAKIYLWPYGKTSCNIRQYLFQPNLLETGVSASVTVTVILTSFKAMKSKFQQSVGTRSCILLAGLSSLPLSLFRIVVQPGFLCD